MTGFVEYINQRRFQQKHIKLLKSISRVMWLEKLDFYSLDLVRWRAPKLPRMRLKAQFSLGTEQDVLDLVSDPKMDSLNNRDYYLRKHRAGHKLLLGRLNCDIVYYLWVVPEKKDMMDRYLLLNSDEIAVERGFTRKDCRGHGLFDYGLCYLFPLLRDEGYSSCLTEIAPYNLAMSKTASKIGFVRTESFYYWFRHPFRQYVFPRGPLTSRFIKKSRNERTMSASER